ncbi:MAG: transposase [Gammaproteobacteria bacterium]|nr:transposase [Gammaproteobacteria bacterium]
MARYKPIHQGMKLLALDFDRQILPGTFEYALRYLVDHELDLDGFHQRFRNDTQGAAAYDPAALLKIILLAYSRGITTSRKMEAACRENMLFIAVSGDSQPHFTTLAAFIANAGELIAKLFAQVLLICDRQGLIGKELFAIDGVKLPSNASKEKSGTRADFLRQAERMEKAAQTIIDKHQQADASNVDEVAAKREAKQLERLQHEAKQLRDWLADNPEDRKGVKDGIRLSNRTDNESAKMATSKGVVQGYTGVAAVDSQHQIIIEAQAHGTGSEQELLMPVVNATAPLRTPETVITADNGYHSEANLKALAEAGIDAYIPDKDYRQRDERYADQSVHQQKPDPLWNKSPKPSKAKTYKPADFQLAADLSHCLCPAGKRLYRTGKNCTLNGYASVRFQGALRDCEPCTQRPQCLKDPAKTRARQVTFLQGKRDDTPSHTDLMKPKIDSDLGKRMIAQRFATVEPVFGNLRGNKRLHRFTLRSKAKVDGQWKLFCLMHNLEKLAHHGYAA